MAWDDDLHGVHRDIAADPRSPLHVLAGPGTGKTTAMMRRVARLLETGTAPDRVLAVTFTRTAARDLRRQLAALNIPGAERVRATTLHSLCFQILNAEGVFAYTQRRARPLLSHEIEQLVNDLAPHFGGKREVARFQQAYEASWARMQHEEAGAPREQRDIEFEAALLDWLRYHGSMLIGELVPITLRYLRDNPYAEGPPEFDAVLVDEFQDLNKADQTLVDLLAVRGSLAVIGDDNQSIYRFRHANPEGIRKFADTHANTVPYVISECLRCPPNIVRMSNALIAHDPVVRPNVLVPQPQRPDATVYSVQHETVADEADASAAFIEAYLARRAELPPGQVLVLSPNRLFGNAVRDALIRRGKNAMSFFAEDELDSQSAAAGFAVLSLLVNTADRAAFRAWLGLGHAEGHRSAYRRIRGYAEANELEPQEVLRRLAAADLQLPYTGGIIERYRLLQERLAAVRGLEGLALVDTLWPDDEETQRMRNAARRVAIDWPDADQLLPRLTEAVTQPELPDTNGDTIRIMSLHKSKGLTAELVVIVGCVSGAIPSVDPEAEPAERDAILKEQRRLFYVAVTRAKDTLVLSSVRTLSLAAALQNGIATARHVRRGPERIAVTSASPFLAEMGQYLPNTIRGTQWREALGF